MSVIELKKAESTYRNDQLEKWIRSIRGYKVLDAREEEKAMVRCKEGDDKALEELMRSNQRFLLAAARTYSRNADEILDLISEGNLALLEAVERYDFSYGVRFLSYAVHYIKRSMSKWFRDRGLVRQRIRPNVLAFIKEVKDEWMADNGYEIPDWVLSDMVHAEFDRPDKTTIWSRADIMYDEDFKDSEFDANGLIDSLHYSVNDAIGKIDKEDLRKLVEEAVDVACRDEFECEMIVKKYGLFGKEPESMHLFAERYGMTVEELERVRKRILHRMRRFIEGKPVPKYDKHSYKEFIEKEIK